MLNDRRKCSIFDRLVEKGQIEKRWSCVVPAEDGLGANINGERFYAPGEFPSTGARMRQYEIEAPVLAQRAVAKLNLGERKSEITHLIVTSCTGFSAPGIDIELIHRIGLNPTVERTIVGFMGCYAAVNALKLARHIVRSEPQAKVLVVSIELCTLHFQETFELEQMMPFLLFADGCAAALISAEPKGLSMERFYATIFPEAANQMAWHIRDLGFDMVLSSRIPTSVGEAIQRASGADSLGAEAEGHRALGRSSGRSGGARRGGGRFPAADNRAQRLAARPSRLRQHVLGHRAVRAEIASRREQVRRKRLRHVVRPRPYRGDHAVQGRLRRPMPDFSKRDMKPELMDTEIVSYEELSGVLKELTQANELSLAYRPTLAFFKRLAREGRLSQDRPIVVIDAASGYGDMSRKVDRWAEKRGLDMRFIGVDMNPWAACAAEEATPPGRPLSWVTANLFDYRPEGGADIVMSSLFTHHLPDPELVRFIRWMEETARIGWFINDIERHPIPYHFLKFAFWATRRPSLHAP